MTPVTPAPGRSLVFVHPSDELYGADRMLLELVDAVPASTSVQVWLPTDLPHAQDTLCQELERRGVPVRHLDLPILRRAYRTPRALARLAAKTGRIARELRDAAPDVVYCTTSAAFLNVVSARRARVPEIVCHVQEFWSSTDRLVLGPLARRSNRLIAISGAVAAALPDPLRARASVVTNASPDPGPSTPVPGGDRPLRYVVASRWNAWKGHGTLLAAWELAGCPGQLTVLGGAPMVGESVDVPALVAGLSRPDSVTVVGEVADPSGALSDADVVLMPSDDPEPFGLVAIEAFARGRAVIASDAGGLAEIVTDEHDGWLFPPRDAAALAGVLRRLDPARVAAAGVSARHTYESRFTVARYAEQWRAALGLIDTADAVGSADTVDTAETVGRPAARPAQ